MLYILTVLIHRETLDYEMPQKLTDPTSAVIREEGNEKERRKEPTPRTKFKLYSRAGNRCSFPTCDQILAEEGKEHLNSNICHIEAANSDGPRYNPNMTADERRVYDNLILLCKIHHGETDDVEKYSVSALKEMRRNHEAEIDRKLSAEGIIARHPSSLVKVINSISATDFFTDSLPTEPSVSFGIDGKISYNNVARFKPTIEEYRVYQGRLTKIYREIEEQGSFRKQRLLQNIKGFYLEAKGSLLPANYTIENIRANADDLFSAVQDRLFEVVYNRSDNLEKDIFQEDINVAISVIMVDAFMRCKILEEPPNDSK